MTQPKLQGAVLERFITTFLPEGKIQHRGGNELRYVEEILRSIVPSIAMEISCDDLFQAFTSLSYSIAVTEPLNAGEKQKPYLDTNSHAIYIGLDADQLATLKIYVDTLYLKKQMLSGKGLKFYEQLMTFSV